ncbi:MAG: LD-carboxypeptidase, partial [Acidobacteria bacterium]
MLKPKRLRPGDRIAVVAPASSFQREEFDKGVAELERLGFEPVFDQSVFAEHGGYLSGAGHVRARAFLEAWRDPSVKALIAVRGGYGSVHLLPFLEKEDLRQTPKAFIGYSDLTTVLAYLTTRCGIVSFHGPMLDRRLGRGIDAYDRDSFVGA